MNDASSCCQVTIDVGVCCAAAGKPPVLLLALGPWWCWLAATPSWQSRWRQKYGEQGILGGEGGEAMPHLLCVHQLSWCPRSSHQHMPCWHGHAHTCSKASSPAPNDNRNSNPNHIQTQACMHSHSVSATAFHTGRATRAHRWRWGRSSTWAPQPAFGDLQRLTTPVEGL